MRLTIYLDDDLAGRLHCLVPSDGFNHFINQAVAEKVAALEKEQIEREMREGYLATAAESAELARDWDVVDLERWPE